MAHPPQTSLAAGDAVTVLHGTEWHPATLRSIAADATATVDWAADTTYTQGVPQDVLSVEKKLPSHGDEWIPAHTRLSPKDSGVGPAINETRIVFKSGIGGGGHPFPSAGGISSHDEQKKRFPLAFEL